MGYKRARVSAFLFDLLFVVLLTTMVANVDFLNPKLDDYQTVYTEYNEILNEMSNSLTEGGSGNAYYMTEDLKTSMYELELCNLYYYVYYIVFVILYFIIFQWWNNGATLGKKLFKLKVVDNEENNPNLLKYCVRYLFNGSSFIMGIHFITILRLILLFCGLGVNAYFITYTGLSLVSYVFEIVFVIYYFINRKNKGLDDLIAGTKVISTAK